MDITALEKDGLTTYYIKGNIDTKTASDFQARVDEGFAKGKYNLVFDFAKVEYISSAGLRVILYSKKNVERNNGFLKLINVSDDIMEIFEMTGFTDFLSINE